MEITYELTQRDFLNSLLAHRSRTGIAKWSFRVMSVFIFLIPGIGVVSLILKPSMKTFSDSFPLFILGGIWALFIWGLPRWSARTQFSKQPGAKGPRQMKLDTDGVHWRWSGGSADVEWKNFVRLLETKDEFLLYTSRVCFNIVPKGELSAEQIDQVRMMLTQCLPKSK